LVRVVPELGGDPNIFPRKVGSLDAVSDLALVHVDRCRVDVLVPALKGGVGRLLDLSWLRQPKDGKQQTL
jgi:hypothetical protein